MIIRPNGLGELLGSEVATTKPLYTSGNVWYVNSSGGVDAASPAGKDREKPLATLSQAHTNLTAGDIVCLMAGHTETYTAALAISKQCYIVGGGASGGIPTVNFTMNAAAQDTFQLTAAGTEVWNIRFKEASQTNTGSTYLAKVGIAAATVSLFGCYFDMGAKDNMGGVFFNGGSSSCRLENCTFVSTATAVATRPGSAIAVQAAATISDLSLIGLTLSDGTVGYQNPAFNGSGATSWTRLRVRGLSLLLGAEMEVGTLSGYVGNTTSTGGGRFVG